MNYKHPLHQTWQNMKQRCYGKDKRVRAYYAAKKIKVCLRWHNFSNFILDMGEKPPGYTLDRIDSTKGYSPENCRWATREQQNRNRSNNRHIEYNGETKTLFEWSKIVGVNNATIYQRIKRGAPKDQWFLKPKGVRQK